jgi:DNA-binding SARP family transcriptional activator
MSGSTLRTHVAALRRALGPAANRVCTEPAGYLVEAGPGELDLRSFRELSGHGRAALCRGDFAEAARLLRKATALWREPMLADLPDTPQLWPRVTELAEERQLVAEMLIDARLGLGEHHQLIPELRTRCEIDPPQEETFEQLMTALYRSGRRGEACDAYQSLRTRLVESYGTDPGPTVEKLHLGILNDDAALRQLPVAGQPHV